MGTLQVQRFVSALPLLAATVSASAQLDPLSFVTITPITDNNPATSELGRDRVSINSTPFKNESLWTVGNYQFTTNYRDDGKLMVMRRDLSNPVNVWDIRVTEFTSYNINDSHNVPVIGIDGDGFLHLAWGTHGNPLLYTRSTTSVTAGQPLVLTGDTVGNSAAINTMTGTLETGTTYPNFIAIPGSDDLLFNYRTGGSGNGTYRITRWNDATNTWTWTDQTWIKNTDSSGQTYNAYPHNLSYDASGGLHATWTYRYNSSSPTGNSGFQTNHNLHYAYSPNNGVTWYKDMNATVPYTADIDELNSQVIVPIPEGSSLINTGTQAVDAHGRPAIATWWAPHAKDPVPDHTRQYMYVGHDGTNWFTSQITQRPDEGFGGPIPESSLGSFHMGRPQIVFDDYNRALVIYKDYLTGGGITVAHSQSESRDDWEFIQLTTENLGYFEPTLDRTLWESSGQLHLLAQTIDNNSNNGGSALKIVEWDAAAALGRVIKWTAATHSSWDSVTNNFTDLGTPTDFDDFDDVTFDESAGSQIVALQGSINAGKVVVDGGNYTFTGPGALTSGSLSVVGGSSLVLATNGNTYQGQTRVSNATLTLTGNTSTMSSKMVIADGGLLIMDSSNASTMTSAFEIWQDGILQIGTPTSTTNVFPDSPTSIVNNGLIRSYTSETLQSVTGTGSVEAAGGTLTLLNNAAMQGGLQVKNGAIAKVSNATGLGTGAQGGVIVDNGGQLELNTSGTFNHAFELAGSGGGNGALRIANAASVTLTGGVVLNLAATSLNTVGSATLNVDEPITGAGGLTKQGTGTLHLKGDNTYLGSTVVSGGLLIVDQSTGMGQTTVQSTGQLEARTVRGNLHVHSGGLVRVNRAEVTATSGVLFEEDFAGGSTALHGTAPDVSFNGANWVAAPTFLANGNSVTGTDGGSATLAFLPENGHVYTLQTSINNIVGDTDWFALGFVSGQASSNSANNRFITGNVIGKAWALYRGTHNASTNTTFLGTQTVGNSDSASWLAGSSASGGSVQIRLTLDTTGGPGTWTSTMLADTGSGFQIIRNSELLNNESINAVGIANSNAGDLTGTLTSFLLQTSNATPNPTPQDQRTLNVLGNLSLDPGAVVQMTLFNTTLHDLIDVTGSLNAGGLLSVAMEQGAPAPQLGDSFDLLDFASATGSFDDFDLPTLSSGLYWNTSALLTTGILSVTNVSPFDPADLDQDGDVDDADFGIAFAAFTGPGGSSNSPADLDHDGDVDDADFGIAFAAFTGPGGNVNVPEPTSLILLGISGLLLAGRRKR